MSKSFRLTIRKEDGPFWRQLVTGLWRGVAIYVAIGLVLAVILRVAVGPDAWRDFGGEPNALFALASWGLGWPLMLVLLLASR